MEPGRNLLDRIALIQDGVIGCFELIGEAVKQLSPEVRAKYPQIT
ncbi:hypothetical protein [Cyanothece sp. BG0011]|nr:hypothetical protein [Cyanothece sp. BG0011]